MRDGVSAEPSDRVRRQGIGMGTRGARHTRTTATPPGCRVARRMTPGRHHCDRCDRCDRPRREYALLRHADPYPSQACHSKGEVMKGSIGTDTDAADDVGVHPDGVQSRHHRHGEPVSNLFQ